FFHSKLVENRMNFGGAVVNRVRYRLGSHQVKVKDLSGRIDRELDDTALAERLARNLAEYDVLAVRDQKNIDELTRALNGEPVIRIPYLDTDVHDIAGLCQINEYLFVEEDERVERAIS
ncbi:MAG TPA: hypothetical protein PLS38_05130, partial [Solirubrobacterales bacterium]|nr:hypothetical protein [Solirubrobacterales bacterium]